MKLLHSTPAAAPPLTPPGAAPSTRPAPLVAGVGERQLTLTRSHDGRVDVTLSPPPVSHLVLSGGGAKGIAFPGMVQALEERQVLPGVRVISGSSAGAISAALLACGMDAKTFEALSNGLNLPQLLNSQDPLVAWLQNASSTLGHLAGRLPGPAGSLSQRLLDLMPRLQSEALPLETLVRNESRKALLAQIANTPRQTRPAEVMKIAGKLSAGAGPTFGDLEVLSRYIPAIKQLSITGTGMFDGRPQLVVFNASLTPDMDIARAAHISGSLPVLFKSPTEQGQVFQDGGLLANTPAPGVLDRSFTQSPLSQPESLIIRFEPDEGAQPASRGGFVSSLIDRVTGTPHSAAQAFQGSRLQPYADQTVTLPLNTAKGDFRGLLNGTVNFTMSADEKKHLQHLARQAVTTHLDHRAATREHVRFDSLEDAVLAMDEAMLKSAEPALAKDPAARAVLLFRREAKQALQVLDRAIADANRLDERLTLTPALLSALRNLDALARSPGQVAWLGRQLNAPGQRNFQQLLQVVAKQPAGETAARSPVVKGAVAEMKQRDIAVIAENFTRQVIYPSLFHPGQPDANVELLRRSERELAQVTTVAEFNRVLDGIIAHYGARNKPWGKPFSSTTVEMAKAWRQRER
ncbi:patatin-like phospholipase family protein [Pseudomonas sp. SDO528_S397]